MAAVEPTKMGDMTKESVDQNVASQRVADQKLADQRVADQKVQSATSTAKKAHVEEAKRKSKEDFDKMRADQATLNEETMARQNASRPTPTIEELHMAPHGVPNEPDGSPEQDIHATIISTSKQIEVDPKTKQVGAKKPDGVYATRAATADKDK